MQKFFHAIICYLQEIFHEKIKIFIPPAILGGISGGTFLFSQPTLWVYDLGQYFLRLAGAAGIAFCTGLAGVAAKDFMDKLKAKKKRKYERRSKKTQSTGNAETSEGTKIA